MSEYHIPVLLHESVEALSINPSGIYLDATFGGGGHSREILTRLGPEGRLIVLDQDAEALENAPEDERVIPCHTNFRFVHNFVRYSGFEGVDGIIADLGVSSHQFDTGERGFSFRFENAELDMRMNTLAKKNARMVVNDYEQEDLERIFRMYGEVEGSGRVASLICSARSKGAINTTGDLEAAVSGILPKFGEHKVLAKIYQALRIEVNDEMKALEKFMPLAIKSLNPGGVLAVITYHSLEDRIVKNAIRDAVAERVLDKVNKKPVLPSEEEIAANTRARSAKLRIARRREE
ncbi:MAG: 16S rRNA (cytosine(1402)-N(4))-methyltransferase RsmH [Bacteroidales bacterium]|nr:16S rRNA (cytosine(1402)-N(4))-methyltransferase RsmH [Bacteroidales bacterium]